MGASTKDKRDIYYRLAKKRGYRARSAYKLLQINSEFDIFKDVKYTVDLCSAPGSWSQVASSFSKVISVDLQLVQPISNTIVIQDDITTESCMTKIMKIVNNDDIKNWKNINEKNKDVSDSEAFDDMHRKPKKCVQSDNLCDELENINLESKARFDKNSYKVQIDLVLCDGAPDVTGIHDLDEYFQTELLLAALNITTKIAKVGGKFIGKCFRSEDTGYLVRHFKKYFERVMLVKPKSSRDSSIECFIYCENMNDCDADPYEMDLEGEVAPVECIGIGNILDDYADDDSGERLEDNFVASSAPFKQAIETRRINSQMKKTQK